MNSSAVCDTKFLSIVFVFAFVNSLCFIAIVFPIIT